MIARRLPYHCAVLRHSLASQPHVADLVRNHCGVIFTSLSHWGLLCSRGNATARWIVNQCDADTAFWDAYARQTANPVMKAAALVNDSLARRFYPTIYRRAHCVIAVCPEDRDLTLHAAPGARVEVCPNGVDCAKLTPCPPSSGAQPRILFTGTAARRNIDALRWFTRCILPRIREARPDAVFVVGGRFDASAQRPFLKTPGIRFTGPVPDMRTVFADCDVFVAPFRDTHGSKLKIAEAMAMNRSIVSTPEGVRGFPLRHGESVLTAETPEAFAQCVLTLLGDGALRARLAATARRIAETQLDWSILGRHLAAIVADVASGHD